MNDKPELTMAERRKLWTDALRSGEYLQTTGSLRFVDRFCCLGVACDLYAKWHPDFRVLKSSEGLFNYGLEECSGCLPSEVKEWLGVCDDEGNYVGGCLVTDNDKALMNFEQIADLIDSNPPGLFVDPEPERPEGSAK